MKGGMPFGPSQQGLLHRGNQLLQNAVVISTARPQKAIVLYVTACHYNVHMFCVPIPWPSCVWLPLG